jgi:hypothetical protein
MSEEEGRRQQERQSAAEGADKGREYFMWAGVLLLLVVAYAAGGYYRNHKYDAFAKCLAAHQAKMYGHYLCPHCAEQKREFGASFRYLPYVECGVKGSREPAPACKIAGIKGYPSWQFGMDPPKEGVLSLEELSDKTGCKLP